MLGEPPVPWMTQPALKTNMKARHALEQGDYKKALELVVDYLEQNGPNRARMAWMISRDIELVNDEINNIQSDSSNYRFDKERYRKCLLPHIREEIQDLRATLKELKKERMAAIRDGRR